MPWRRRQQKPAWPGAYPGAINRGHPLADGLVSMYLFQEADWTTLLDWSDNANNGVWVPTGGVPYNTSPWGVAMGPFNDSLYAHNFTKTSLFPSGSVPRTLSALYKLDTNNPANYTIFGWGDNSADGCRWNIFDSGGTSGSIGGEFRNASTLTPEPRDGRWHLVSIVLPAGVTSSAGVLVYIDGISRATTTGGTKTINTLNNVAALGRFDSFTGFGWNSGRTAGVWVWSRALSDADQVLHWADLFGMVAQPRRRIFGPLLSSSQTINVGALGPARSFGSPTVSGGPQTVSVSALGPHRNFINPVVQLATLSVGALSGPRLLAGPTVTVQQTLDVSSIASPRSLGSPRVAHVTTLAMGALGPHRSFGSPTVSGGPQWLSVSSISSPRRFTAPTMIGGNLSTELYLSGVRIPELSWVVMPRIEAQTIGRWRATFSIENPAVVPVLGQTVLIVDYGRRLFAGCITECSALRYLSTNYTQWTCTAVDKSGICDHRVVTGKTYPTGSDVAGVYLDILANFLNGEGITAGPELIVGAFGTLDADLVLNFPSVTQAYDQLSTQAGLVWWIDSYCVLHASPFADLPAAPFGLTETSYNWRNLIAKTTTQDYYNKLYAVSNLNVLPGGGQAGAGSGVTETFVWNVNEPGVNTAIEAGTGTVYPTQIVCSTAIGAVQSLTVNGVPQTVVDFGSYNGESPSGSDYLWLFAGPATGNPNQFVSPVGLPPLGATIVIEYTPYQSTASSLAQYGTALAPLNPHGDPLGTCGSGLYEGVVQVENISDQDQLNAIAAAVLARIGGVPNVVSYETDQPGLAPGMKQSINIPLSQCNALECLITSVAGQPPAKSACVDLGFGGAFRYQIEARTNLDPGNWLKWYERLLARTDNPLPVLTPNTATFVLGAGSALSSGNTLANPYIVNRTGVLSQLLLAAGTPPTGQDLILTLTRNGVALPYAISLPDGTTPNSLVTIPVPASPQLYFFQGDVLNVNATYSETGSGTPTAAAKVTFQVVWLS